MAAKSNWQVIPAVSFGPTYTDELPKSESAVVFAFGSGVSAEQPSPDRSNRRARLNIRLARKLAAKDSLLFLPRALSSSIPADIIK